MLLLVVMSIEAVADKRRPAAEAWSRRPQDAAALGTSGGVAAGRMVSGDLGVALPCASAKRSRLLPEVVDDCSHVGRRLSPRGRGLIRKMNGSAFALNFLETGGIGLSESCEKVGTPSCATASPVAHNRTIGKYVLDVCGGNDFLTKATQRLGLRGYVLDTEC